MNYLSDNYPGNWSPWTLFIHPYKEGGYNLKIAFPRLFKKNPPTVEADTVCLKIRHFFTFLGLVTPLLNTILFISIRAFANYKQSKLNEEAERSPIIDTTSANPSQVLKYKAVGTTTPTLSRNKKVSRSR